MKVVGGSLCFEVCDTDKYIFRREREARRKRRVFRLVMLAIFAISVAIGTICVDVAYAGDNKSENEVRAELSSAVDEAIDNLDTDALQKFINSLSEEQREVIDIGDVKSALRALASGNAEDFFAKLLLILSRSVGVYFAGFLPEFITIIIICLLKNMLGGMTSGFANGASEVVHIVCYCAVIIILMTGIGTVISAVTDTINALTEFSSIIFPILLTLLSMLGGSTTVATYSPLMAALSGVIMRIIVAVVVPSFIATIVFTIVGNVSKNIKLDGLTKTIKSASTWLIGIVFGLFATFLTIQGVTGGVIDKFGFNVAKFALSSYVPVLGGYLSDGFDLLSTSLVLVKNALGYSGAIVLVCIVVFPLLKVVIFSLALRLTAAISEPIGDARMSNVLSTAADNMNLLITALAGVAFLFYVLILMLIGSCNMGL